MAVTTYNSTVSAFPVGTPTQPLPAGTITTIPVVPSGSLSGATTGITVITGGGNLSGALNGFNLGYFGLHTANNFDSPAQVLGLVPLFEESDIDCRYSNGGYAADVVPNDMNYVLPVFGDPSNSSSPTYFNDFNTWLLNYPLNQDAVNGGNFSLTKLVGGTYIKVATLNDNTYGIPYNNNLDSSPGGRWPFFEQAGNPNGNWPYVIGSATNSADPTKNYQGYTINWCLVLNYLGAGTYKFNALWVDPTTDTSRNLISPPFCLNQYDCNATDGTVKFESVFTGGNAGDVDIDGQVWSLNETVPYNPPSSSHATMNLATYGSGLSLTPINGILYIGTNELTIQYSGGYSTTGTGIINNSSSTYPGGYRQYIVALINSLAGYSATISGDVVTITGPYNANGQIVNQVTYDTTGVNSVQFYANNDTVTVTVTSIDYANTAFALANNGAPYPISTINYNNGGHFAAQYYSGGFHGGYTVPAGHTTQIFNAAINFDNYNSVNSDQVTVSAQLYVNGVPASDFPQSYDAPSNYVNPPAAFSKQFLFGAFNYNPGDVVTLAVNAYSHGDGNQEIQITAVEFWNTAVTTLSSHTFGDLSGGEPSFPAGTYNIALYDSVRIRGFFGKMSADATRTSLKYQGGQINKVRDEWVRKYKLTTAQMPYWLLQRLMMYAFAAPQLYVSDYNHNNENYNIQEIGVVCDGGLDPHHYPSSRYPMIVDVEFKDAIQSLYRDNC